MFGSMTSAIAPFGLKLRPTPSSTCSARSWIAESIVSRMSPPARAARSSWSEMGWPSASLTSRRRAVVPAQDPVLGVLETGEAVPVGTDGAEHLGGERALRVDPP